MLSIWMSTTLTNSVFNHGKYHLKLVFTNCRRDFAFRLCMFTEVHFVFPKFIQFSKFDFAAHSINSLKIDTRSVCGSGVYCDVYIYTYYISFSMSRRQMFVTMIVIFWLLVNRIQSVRLKWATESDHDVLVLFYLTRTKYQSEQLQWREN